MRFSKTQGCFFPESEQYASLPDDIITVPDEDYIGAMSRNPGDTLDVVGDRVVVVPKPAPTLSDIAADLIKRIDTDADAIYRAALGARATEYAEAESQAQTFKTAGYSGETPAYVQAWADATGETAQWAADDILSTAAAWRTAQTAIRANRLARKEAARKAGSSAEIAAVKAQWNAFVVAIKAQLGLV